MKAQTEERRGCALMIGRAAARGVWLAVVYFVLIFPWWINVRHLAAGLFSLVWFFNWAAQTARDIRPSGKTARALRAPAFFLRAGVSFSALLFSFLFFPVLFDVGLGAAVCGALLAAASAIPRFRFLFLPVHAAVMGLTGFQYFSAGPLADQARSGSQPAWIEPILVKDVAEPGCARKHPETNQELKTYSMEIEPDDSALYATVRTGRRNEPFVTMYKVGLDPGVASGCWYDRYAPDVALDAPARRLYVPNREQNSVSILNADTLERVGALEPHEKKKLLGVFPQPERDRIWLLNDNVDSEAFRLSDLAYQFTVRDALSTHARFYYDRENNEMFAANTSFKFRLVSAFQLEKGGAARSGRPGFGSYGVAAAPGTDSLYVTDFFLGMLYELDKNTFKTRRAVRLKQGVRHVLVDAERRVLFVGDKLTGKLYVLNLDDLNRRTVLDVGSGIETIVRSPKKGDVYLGTKAGVFRLNFDEMKTDPFRAVEAGTKTGLKRVGNGTRKGVGEDRTTVRGVKSP